MKKLTNIEKVAKIIGGKVDCYSDGSGSWILLENDTHVINIGFDGKGKHFEDITIAEKVYEVVDEKVIAIFK